MSSFGPGLALLLLVLTPLSLEPAGRRSRWPSWPRRCRTKAATSRGSVARSARSGPSRSAGGRWLDSFVDVAVYPALFVEYLRFWYPAMAALERWLLAVLFIVVLTGLNVVGVRPTGRAAVVLAVVALLPIALLVVSGCAAAAPGRRGDRSPPRGERLGASLGLGLAVVMWNYSGWDTPSTCARRGHARRSTRSGARSSWRCRDRRRVRAAGRRPARQRRHRLVEVGHGCAAGLVAAAVGGLARARRRGGRRRERAGLFLTLLLTNSRLPYVLAARWSAAGAARARSIRASARRGWRSCVSAALYSAFAVFSFKELIVLNVWLYSLSLLVELAAFVWLRVRQPSLARPWRVPGGIGHGPGGCGGAGGAGAARDGDGGLAQHAGGGGRRADRPRGVRVGAGGGASRLSSMTCARQVSVASV